MQLSDRFQNFRDKSLSDGEVPVPDMLQGVSKKRIGEVLKTLDLATPDQVDAVFALLDNILPSWFSRLPDVLTFSDGATIGQIACHIGILQRGKSQLDREGRDYWVKPLRAIGAIELVYADSESGTFLPGHPIPKSPNSAYRLNSDFIDILRASESSWQDHLNDWAETSVMRKRLLFQAEQAQATQNQIDTAHLDLIRACCDKYSPAFLPGYQVLYVDDADGERISEKEIARLAKAGLTLELDDAMPDVLLWNPDTDELWVIEAVTSDGEVDQQKVERLRGLAERHHKKAIHFTTAYASWKAAALRQGKHKNLPDGTYFWVRDDASKHFHVESFISD